MIFQRLRAWWRKQQDKRFLRRHGCPDWATYHRRFDPGIYQQAFNLKYWYPGYPYLRVIEQPLKEFDWDVELTIEKLVGWCEENCQGKWRHDFHGLYYDTHSESYVINDLASSGLVLAFVDERDALMFTLRWGA